MLADFAITKPTVGGSSGTWGTELNAALDVLVAHPGIKVVVDADAKAAYVPLLGQVILQADTGVLYKCTNATGPVWAEVGPAAVADSTLTTKGDLLVYGSALARLGVGTNGQVLTADSAQALGVKWAPPAGGGSSYIKYDPDEPPETANAKDDEFNDSLIDAKWTWANQGSATAEEGGKTGLISITPANNAEYRCLTQAVPAGAWTLTAKVIFGGDFIADSYAGIVVLPAADGAFEALNIGKDGSSATNLRAENWTNWTTFGSQRKLTYWNATVCYLRIEWNGTKLTYSISSTGVAYAKLFASFSPSFTPGRFGITARGNALPSYFDWFRVVE